MAADHFPMLSKWELNIHNNEIGTISLGALENYVKNYVMLIIVIITVLNSYRNDI